MIFAKTKSKTQTLGLALGSGGARGWAHVGALRALREANLEPDVIAGTSAGSIVAAGYASGQLHALDQIADALDWRLIARLFVEFGFQKDGLIKGTHVMRFLKEIIPVETFESLRIPVAIVATDLEREKEVVFNTGSVHHAIRASIAIPGVFTPVMHGRHVLADGGLVNPVPVSVARALGATKVIAIDINTHLSAFPEKPVAADEPAEFLTPERYATLVRFISPEYVERITRTFDSWRRKRQLAAQAPKPPTVFTILTRTFRLYENTLTRTQLVHTPPDLLITPPVGHIPTLDFAHARETIDIGYRATLKALESGI